MRILGGIGLEPLRVRRVIAMLFQFVRGMALVATEHRQAAPETGVPDEEWWAQRSALMAEFAPDFTERFPALAALESTASLAAMSEAEASGAASHMEQEAREAFRVGLDLILDGVEAAVRTDSDGTLHASAGTSDGSCTPRRARTIRHLPHPRSDRYRSRLHAIGHLRPETFIDGISDGDYRFFSLRP